MLVLSRHTNEATVLLSGGQEICRILICEVRGNKVRLGFKAPGDIKIYREELLSRSGQQPPPLPRPGSGGEAGQPEQGGSGQGFDPPG
jgi:carbon storage regulator CsrA